MPGNLIPVAITAPFLVFAIQEIVRVGVTGKAIILAFSFLIVGWLAVNFLGLIGNRSLRRVIEMRFKDQYGYDQTEKWFVGFSRPGKVGLLDPHEDLGFLILRDDVLEFFGEQHQIAVPWALIQSASKRPNIHTWLGLGGWVAIEAQDGDRAMRLQIEPRVRATHFGNNRLRPVLIAAIEQRLRPKENQA